MMQNKVCTTVSHLLGYKINTSIAKYYRTLNMAIINKIPSSYEIILSSSSKERDMNRKTECN
jgi:hypothetical protein